MMNKIKEKNNLWLWFYRYNSGTFKSYPDLCPLVWGGLMGFIFFMLSPITNVWYYIKSLRKNISFLEERSYTNRSGVNIFFVNLAVAIIYFFNVMIYSIYFGDYNSFGEIPAWIYYYGWLFSLVSILAIIGVMCLIIAAIDSVGNSDNIEVFNSSVKSKYKSICPRIEWIKNENKGS